MRDAHRVRDQIELRLDNRQIVTFVIGSLVVLGVVFALGVLVGKQLAASNQPAPRPADPLAAIDAREQQRAALDADAGPAAAGDLTFAAELTKPRSVASAIEPTRPAGTPGVGAPKAVGPVVALADQPAERAAAAPAGAPAVATAEPAPAAALQGPAAGPDAAPVQAASAETRPAAPAKAETTAEKGSRKESLKAAFEKAGESRGDWCLQVASFPKRSEAAKEAKHLSARGYKAEVASAEVSGRGRVYRVRVAGYSSRSKAEAAADAFKRKMGKTPIVTSCP